jgi:hypothetical protein
LLRLHINPFDYTILGIYFALVVAIGVFARRAIATSEDFLLSGRSLPAWVTGLAFISANLGAIEILGMAANGAQYGLPTVHFYWIGAVPAMVFLGVVMMPFYYGSRVRSVPEFLLRRFNPATHLFNALTFALAAVLIAGVNLYALALVINALIGWPIWLSIAVSAFFVLAYITLGGLSGAIYNEVLQFFVIIAGLIPLVIIGLHSVGGWSGLQAKEASIRARRPGLGRARPQCARPGERTQAGLVEVAQAAGRGRPRHHPRVVHHLRLARRPSCPRRQTPVPKPRSRRQQSSSTCGCSSAGCSSSTGSCSPWPGSSPHRKTWPKPARSTSTCGWASACSSSRCSSSAGGGSGRSAVTNRRPTRPGPGNDRPGQAPLRAVAM